MVLGVLFVYSEQLTVVLVDLVELFGELLDSELLFTELSFAH